MALLFGLFVLEEHLHTEDTIQIISDSQLLVRQLTGIYKVKQPHLQPLYALCKKYIQKVGATVTHVLREENIHADAMANYGVDCKNIPPKKYIALLKQHEIHL